MKQYERLRDFFKDFVVPITIGCCSILIAFYANKLAESANKTAELQALIAKNAEAPTIELAHIPGGLDSNETLTISILDGKYSNFTSDTVSFLTFTFSGINEDQRWVELDKVGIPLLYYDRMKSSQALYGTVAEWTCGSTKEVERFCEECEMYYTEEKHFEPGTREYDYAFRISVVTCLRCTYLNLLREEESVYYLLDPNSFTAQINEEQGEKYFQKYKDMTDGGLIMYYDYIYDCNISDTFHLIDTINAAGDLYKDGTI